MNNTRTTSVNLIMNVEVNMLFTDAEKPSKVVPLKLIGVPCTWHFGTMTREAAEYAAAVYYVSDTCPVEHDSFSIVSIVSSPVKVIS
jgi:hypothetical protein